MSNRPNPNPEIQVTRPRPYKNASSLPEASSFGILPFLRHSGLDIRHSLVSLISPALVLVSQAMTNSQSHPKTKPARRYPPGDALELTLDFPFLTRGHDRLMRRHATGLCAVYA